MHKGGGFAAHVLQAKRLSALPPSIRNLPHPSHKQCLKHNTSCVMIASAC